MLPATYKETESLLPNQICRRFSITEILSATNNFDDALVIGRGGFGIVYQGPVNLGSTTNVVAIKRLHSMSNQGAPEFRAEVEMLSHLRHCNLVSLMGYCNDTSEMVIVYEYMPQGTLEDHLQKAGTPLSWLQRLKVCIGAARGLDYLHTGTGNQQGVIHRDVKSSNILLDEKFAAKISDFGLAKIGPTNQTRTYVSTGVKGTFGYMDPCYFYTGKLTRKSDVYAFGVVLFEVLCGRPAVDKTLDEEQWGLATWAADRVKEGKLIQIVDSRLKGQIANNCLKEFARIAVRCLHNQPKQRPTMAEVVAKLECVLSLQERVNSSAVKGTFVEKLRSIFSLRAHFKVNSRMPAHVAGSEGEASAGDKLVNTPVTVGGAKVEVVHIAANDFIQFDNGNQVVAKRRKRLCVRSESEVTVLRKAGQGKENWIRGSALILTSDASWSAWLILQAVVYKLSPARLSMNVLIFFFASLLQSSILAIFFRSPSLWRLEWNIQLWTILYCGLVISGLVYYLQTWCISNNGPVFAAMFSQLLFVVTTILSGVVFAQHLHLGSLIGALLIIVGLYCVLWGKQADNAVEQTCEIAKGNDHNEKVGDAHTHEEDRVDYK